MSAAKVAHCHDVLGWRFLSIEQALLAVPRDTGTSEGTISVKHLFTENRTLAILEGGEGIPPYKVLNHANAGCFLVPGFPVPIAVLQEAVVAEERRGGAVHATTFTGNKRMDDQPFMTKTPAPRWHWINVADGSYWNEATGLFEPASACVLVLAAALCYRSDQRRLFSWEGVPTTDTATILNKNERKEERTIWVRCIGKERTLGLCCSVMKGNC